MLPLYVIKSAILIVKTSMKTSVNSAGYLKIGMSRLALPIRDQLEGARAGAFLALDLVLEDVHVEIRGRRILLSLPP